MNAIWIVLPILTLLMFELGLTLQTEDFKLFRKRPRPIIAGLAGQIILLPMLAFALGHVFQLEPLFILIACSPGGSSSNIFSMIAKGDVALSVSLTACSSIITLFTIPVIMEFATHFVDSNLDIDIHLPVGSLIMQNLVLMLLPIVAGNVRKWQKGFIRYCPRQPFPHLSCWQPSSSYSTMLPSPANSANWGSASPFLSCWLWEAA